MNMFLNKLTAGNEPKITMQVSLFLEQKKPIIIFGAGNLGKKIGGFLISRKHNVIAFADNNKKSWGTNLLDVEIRSPKEFTQDELVNAIWLVAIWSPNHSYAITKRQLTDAGVVNVFPAVSIMQLFPADLLPHYHFQTPDYYLSHETELSKVFDILADEESKKQFI